MPLELQPQNQLALPAWGDGDPGCLTAMPGGGCQLMDIDQLPVIDSATMSARARICTPRQDRQGDIIEPSGVDWSDYAYIGVVKYEHGFTGISLPIAKSFDPNDNLTVEYSIDEDAIYARSFFSDRIELSAQMFALIEEGFLRATSIHVIPIAGGFVSRSDGHYVKCSSMLEYSWCTVGINPSSYAKALTAQGKYSEVLALQLEASTRILNRGTIGDRQLLPQLAKCLSAVQPERQHIVRGCDSTAISDDGEAMGTKTLTTEEVNKLTPTGLAKALADVATFDADTVKQLRFKAKSMDDQLELPMAKADVPDTTEPETIPDEVAEDPTSSSPMGAQYLSGFHSALSETLASATDELLKVEKDDVKAGVQPIIDDLQAKLVEIEGLYSKIYPDEPALVTASTTEGDESESPETMAKSWAAQPRSQFQLEGLAARLTTVASGQVSGTKAKSILAGTVRDLRLLTAQAKSFKPPVAKPDGEFVPKAEHDALKEKHERLAAKTQKLVNKMKGQPADLQSLQG